MQGRWVGRDASGNRIAQTLLGVGASVRSTLGLPAAAPNNLHGAMVSFPFLGVSASAAAPAARPGRKQFHHCCYPLGPPDLYDVECSTTGPDGSTATTELLDVERTPGDLPTLTSPGLVFQPAVVHTDELAAESIAALFPGIRPTARTVVCMGPMSLRLSAPTAGAVAT